MIRAGATCRRVGPQPTFLLPKSHRPSLRHRTSRRSPSEFNGARVTGGTPGRPFLFRIPATGKPPLTLQRGRTACRSASGCTDRHHLRQDRASRRERGQADGARARRVGAQRAANRRRQRRACAHAAAWAGTPGTSGVRRWMPRRCSTLPAWLERQRAGRRTDSNTSSSTMRGTASAAPNGEIVAQREIPGHARAGGCRARARPEAGHLLLTRAQDLRADSKAAGSTRRRTPRHTQPGESIF